MNYKDKINTFIKIIMESIEFETSIKIILDADLSYDIAKEIYYNNKSLFKGYTEDEFDNTLNGNNILSLCVLCSSDGKVKLFLEEVFDCKGNTLVDNDSAYIFIQDDLYDCVDTSVFDGQVAVLIEDKESFDKVIGESEDDETEK